MTGGDNYNRLLAILLLTIIACLGLYWLPDNLWGFSLKKLDLLSDIRHKSREDSLDSLKQALENGDGFVVDSILITDSTLICGFDSASLYKRDSVYLIETASLEPDTTNVRIEDYSIGHTGLHRFFKALNQINTLGRPVRIAFLGDSFIEGDIIVADFRAQMQAKFGGRGVGFVPIASQVEQYRPTINQRSKGWKTHSILSDKKNKYILTGLLFDANVDEASISFKTVETYPGLETISTVKFYYASNEESELRFLFNGSQDTVLGSLPPTDRIAQYEVEGYFTDGSLRFRNSKALQALGIALEDSTGIVVDNFSLRGNSGVTLSELDKTRSEAFNEIRPYDLIVIQYGLNVATENVRDYSFYRDRMVEAIKHIQACYPESDILLLGVSDRSHYRQGGYRTMPSVVSLHYSQQQAAKLAHVPFWSVFGAMGGENGMVRYVKNRWASKDYTHLSFRGGKEIADLLFNAILLEKDIYDKMEKIAD